MDLEPLHICCGDFERLGDDSLVLHIFTFLGLRDLLRLRAVCKSWRDAVLSPRFVKIYNLKPRLHTKPWFAFRVRTQVPDGIDDSHHTYDYLEHFDYGMQLENHTELWIPGDSSQGESDYSVPRMCPLPLGPPGSCFVGMCSSGGLVCGRLMEHRDSMVFAVGNPITNSWRVLPPAPVLKRDLNRPAYDCVCMQTTPLFGPDFTSSYHIIVLYQELVDSTELVEVEENTNVMVIEYDSRTGRWESGPDFELQSALASPSFTATVIFNCCVADGVHVGYNPSTKTWSCCGEELIDDDHTQHADAGTEWPGWRPMGIHIFVYKGHHYLWTMMVTNVDLIDLGMSIWKLEREPRKWRLISRILWKDLGCPRQEYDADIKVECVGDTLVISCFYKKHTYGALYPIIYDIASSTWMAAYNESPSLSLIDANKDVECSYAFLPNLVARP